MVSVEIQSPPSPPQIQSSSSPNSNGDIRSQSIRHSSSMITLVLSCTVAAGVQFGWALQLSLLTPYIQVNKNSQNPMEKSKNGKPWHITASQKVWRLKDEKWESCA